MNNNEGFSLEQSITEGEKKKIKKKQIIWSSVIIIVLLCIIIIMAIIPLGDNNDSKAYIKEQKCYELILNCSYKFKNPASVRVVSGYLTSDYKTGCFRLSAENGLGAVTTGYYFCGYNDNNKLFFYDLEEMKSITPSDTYNSMIEGASYTNDFDVSIVNNKLALKWGN